MTILADIRTNLQEDSTRLSDADVNTCIAHALKELTADYPRKVTREGTGDGTKKYPLFSDTGESVVAAVNDWDRGVSALDDMKLPDPADSDLWLPVDMEFWRVGDDLYGSTWLPTLFLLSTIATGDLFRLAFSIAWTEADPELDGRLYTAAVELGTAYSHAAISAEYASMTNATYQADSVDHGGLSRQHMDLHDLHRRNYRKQMGLMEEGGGVQKKAASEQKDLVDFKGSWPGGVSLRRYYNR